MLDKPHLEQDHVNPVCWKQQKSFSLNYRKINLMGRSLERFSNEAPREMIASLLLQIDRIRLIDKPSMTFYYFIL